MEVLASSEMGKHIEDRLFQLPYNEALVHQVVNSYLISSRAGTKAQKNRAEVRGGGKKPWRQKGTGRARTGTINNPIWRSGALAFAAKPKSYKQKINKKMYALAVKTILSELHRQNRVSVVNLAETQTAKTKDFVSAIAKSNLGLDLLIVLSDQIDVNLILATRNLPKVKLINVAALNPLDLVSYEKILLQKSALDALSDRYITKVSEEKTEDAVVNDV